MKITSNSIHFTCEEVFQLLHDQDQVLWEKVRDLVSYTADELYSLSPVIGGKRSESVVSDGMNFDSQGVFWTNKDSVLNDWLAVVEHK